MESGNPSSAYGRRDVLLVAFYNRKALGVRFLESALRREGFSVRTVFFKDFNSIRPTEATGRELDLLESVIRETGPGLVSLSVMSSMYFQTVELVLERVKTCFSGPVVCGGVFATMFPSVFLSRGVPYVIRGDGERALPRLAGAVQNGKSPETIPGLCFRKEGEDVCNPIGDLPNQLDEYGIPTVNSEGSCLIENDRLTWGDPQLSSRSYETITSRGCPFSCSYCCSAPLRSLLPPGVHGIRFRSVESVMEELREAKKQCKHLAFIHFYDEIFPTLPGWIDSFVEAYRKEIRLPFTIWSHPKTTNPETLKKLVSAGLTEVIIGIQSGSDHIRKEVFDRQETREEILTAVNAVRESGVFWASYDLMLLHPFEDLSDLKETFCLLKEMKLPFELQIHGLNFLPGTPIVQKAIRAGLFTEEQMERALFAPMSEQFGNYWSRVAPEANELLYRLIYCMQFRFLRTVAVRWESCPENHRKGIAVLYGFARRQSRIRYYSKKARVVLRSALYGLFYRTREAL
ncbi:MAG: radical SAM protein [Clostridia bacterium]|nr:radical SAM protein [Clostridia bacterium]